MELDELPVAAVAREVLGERLGNKRLPRSGRPEEDELPLLLEQVDDLLEPRRGRSADVRDLDASQRERRDGGSGLSAQAQPAPRFPRRPSRSRDRQRHLQQTPKGRGELDRGTLARTRSTIRPFVVGEADEVLRSHVVTRNPSNVNATIPRRVTTRSPSSIRFRKRWMPAVVSSSGRVDPPGTLPDAVTNLVHRGPGPTGPSSEPAGRDETSRRATVSTTLAPSAKAEPRKYQQAWAG